MGCTSSKSAETIDSVSKQNKQPSPAPANRTAASPASPKDANGTAKAKNGDVHQHSAEPPSLNASVAENNQEKPHVVATNHNGKCGAEGEREANTTSATNGDIVRIDDIHVETSDTAARVEQPAGGEIKASVQSDVDSRIVTEQLTTHATAKTNEDIAVNHVDEQKHLEGESAVAIHVAEAADTQKHDEPEKFDQHVGKADEIAVVQAEKHDHAEPTDYVTLEAAKHIHAEGEQKVPEADSQPRLERAAPLEAATENTTEADDHHHHAQSAEVTAEAENHTTEKLQEAAPEVDEQPQVAPATPHHTEAEAHADDHHATSAEHVTEEVVSQENVPEEVAHSEAEHNTPVEATPEDAAHVELSEQVAAQVDDHHEESEEKVAEDSQLQDHEASHEEESHAKNDSVAEEQPSADSVHSTEEVTFPAVPKSTDNEVSGEDTQPLSAEVEVANNDSQSAANLSTEADEIAAAETSHSDHVSNHDDSAASKSQDEHDESNTTGEPNESTATEQPADQTEN